MPIMPSRLAPSRRAETPRSPPPSPLPLSLVPVRQPPGRLGDAVCELKRLINIWNKGGRFRGRTPERYTAGYDGRYWMVKGREGGGGWGRGRGWTATWDTILGFGTLRKNPSSRVALHLPENHKSVDWETHREKAWIFLEAINVCRAIYHPFNISCLKSCMLFSALCILEVKLWRMVVILILEYQ